MKYHLISNVRLVEKETPYISFPAYEQYPFLVQGFSTRLGGVSKGIYSTMNLSFSRGDDDKNVVTNYERMAKSLGVNPHTFVLSHQVHKTNIKRVTKEDCGKGLYQPRDYDEIDGFVTNEAGVTLVTAYADCVPLFFVDPVKKAIGASHAGWRGSVARIGPKTVERMQQEFGSRPEDIKIVIGPSICQDCYEVSEDVAEEFRKVLPVDVVDQVVTKQSEYKFKSKEDIGVTNEQYQVNSIKNLSSEKKYQLNLWLVNYYFLISTGVPKENITISGLCTCCNHELLHSHRASKGQRGGLCGFLGIGGE